jgi:hypothetical protein
MTLQPGDVILTGTPEGVVNVKAGDEVVCEIDGMGASSTPSSDDTFANAAYRSEPMRIQHLINGQQVDSARILRDRQPGHAGGAGRGGQRRRGEVNAAVAAAKAAFPAWAGLPAAGAREADAQAGRPDRRSTCPRSRAPRPRHRPGHRADGKQLVPRAADNFYYFAEMCSASTATPTRRRRT